MLDVEHVNASNQGRSLRSVLFSTILFSIVFLGCQRPIEQTKAPSRQELSIAPPYERNPLMDSVIHAFDVDIEGLMKETGIPGAAIAIVMDTTVLFEKGYGKSDMNTYRDIDVHTVFRLGSVSKCFAGVLTSILVEEHLLNWDDPVIKYLPDFKLRSQKQAEQLTIRHVLSHTTGLPYHAYTTLIEDGLDLDTMIYRLQDVHNGPVGKFYSYQNVAFSIIAKVIEAATGKSYNEMLQEKILDPLAMKDASMTYQGIMRNTNIAWPHQKKRRKWRRTPVNDTYYNVAPAGGVNASINDMGKLMKALLGNNPSVVSDDALQTIYTPVIKASGKNRNYRRVGKIVSNYYGLGWRIIRFRNDTLIYHGGYVNGYRSELAIYPKDRIAVCVLSNAPGAVADKGIPMFLEKYLKHRPAIQQWEIEHRKVPQDFAAQLH